ncbi:MAG: gfo/Idh/MocA family oxidoreductase, partial [Verrucomicrobia bacterium]|nr:gfo/Idh/MocA family oxidoreductase [Verrucomicrobiota bacterium]
MKTHSRRRFLGTAALGAAALSLPRAKAALAPAPDAASATARKLKLGLIGCGGYGLADVRAAFKAGGVEVVAL